MAFRPGTDSRFFMRLCFVCTCGIILSVTDFFALSMFVLERVYSTHMKRYLKYVCFLLWS